MLATCGKKEACSFIRTSHLSMQQSCPFLAQWLWFLPSCLLPGGGRVYKERGAEGEVFLDLDSCEWIPTFSGPGRWLKLMVLLMGVLGDSVWDRCSKYWEVHLRVFGHVQSMFPLAGGVGLSPVRHWWEMPQQVAAPGGLANGLWKEPGGALSMACVFYTGSTHASLFVCMCSKDSMRMAKLSVFIFRQRTTDLPFFSNFGLQGRVPIFYWEDWVQAEVQCGEHWGRHWGPSVHEEVSPCWFP